MFLWLAECCCMAGKIHTYIVLVESSLVLGIRVQFILACRTSTNSLTSDTCMSLVLVQIIT